MLAEGADRLVEPDLVPINRLAELLFQGAGDLGGRDRAVEPALLADARGELDALISDPGGEIVHLRANPVLAALLGTPEVVDLFHRARRGQDGHAPGSR